MTDVYFFETKDKEDILKKIPMLFDRAFKGLVKTGDFTAVKVHFGELGNKTHVDYRYAKEIVKKVKSCGAKTFVTDTNALYKGNRHNSVDHLENARAHGFTHENLDCPVIIADGLHGHSSCEVEINKKHFKTVKIGSEICEADSIIFSTHFKGHMAAGFGGSIKNICMGCASRAGKQQQHSSIKPEVEQEKCIKCRACGRYCPEDAITYEEGPALINQDKCVGCNECVAACPTGAIEVRWDSSRSDFQEKMAEYAYGGIFGKRVGFINFLFNITKDCDCFSDAGKPIIDCIGVLASTDPVAIDQACLDLVKKRTGKDNIFEELHGFDNTVQLRHGEEIGLGKREYKLIHVK
ncbi:MAG: DUF362 domain-containing protein [Nanoarchaeota archaeon]|nr:DUF362 domain-containing protein [Nanoarchaeota archaeon]